MLNLYASAKALTCLLLFAFLLYSCKTDPPKEATTFYLSSLTVTDGVFKANKNQNIVFNYYLGDTTVLRGWVLRKGPQGRSGTYSSTPDLLLNSVGKSAIKLEPKTFLSNQVLLGQQVKDLVKAIGTREAILYFDPAKDDKTGRLFYNITFKYKGTGSDSSALNNSSATFKTNPSPPYEAYDSIVD